MAIKKIEWLTIFLLCLCMSFSMAAISKFDSVKTESSLQDAGYTASIKRGTVVEQLLASAQEQVSDVKRLAVLVEESSETGPMEHHVYGGATRFEPFILYIQPGDTVRWVGMNIHDSQSIEGLIPEGAVPWHTPFGVKTRVKFEQEGIYIYKCNPHYSVGQAAAIIVGEPVNLEQIKANVTGRAKGVVLKIEKAIADR